MAFAIFDGKTMRTIMNISGTAGKAGLPRDARRSRSGVALVEVMMAGAVIALFMAGLFTMNSFSVKTVRAGRESVAASLIVQERLEQLRKGTWINVTDTAYVQTLLGTAAGSRVPLSGLTERIIINVYPAASPALTPIQVTRSANGTVTINSSNAALQQKPMVRADITATWAGTRTGATRTRTISTVIAQGGIVK